jgi:protein TonB
MFNELPETIPHKSKRKLETFAGAFVLQVVLVVAFIVVQMAMPEKLGRLQLLDTLYMAPPPPPPPAPVSAAPEPKRRAEPEAPKHVSSAAVPAVVEEQPRPVDKPPEVVAPTAIPKDIARIMEAGSTSTAGVAAPGVAGGIPGGVPGGVGGGVLNGVLGGAAAAPPPAPPSEPIRVGGIVKPPKLIHTEQPVYPPIAKASRIEGVVVVEAVVTAEGSVDKVKVISGPAQLVDAAVAAMSKWKYEPTILNGQAISVILNARITFSLSNAQK